jgi:hypothetical protein
LVVARLVACLQFARATGTQDQFLACLRRVSELCGGDPQWYLPICSWQPTEIEWTGPTLFGNVYYHGPSNSWSINT